MNDWEVDDLIEKVWQSVEAVFSLLSFIAILSMPLTSGMRVTMGQCTLCLRKWQSN